MEEQSFDIGQRVSLEVWDRTEPPSGRMGDCIVLEKRAARCQSGTLYLVENMSGLRKEVDTGWINPL